MDVIPLDCLQETVGEKPDETVGRRLREFVSSWGNLGGIAAVRFLVWVMYVIGWRAANQASLLVAGRGS